MGSFEVSNIRLAKMQLKQFSAINLEDNLDMFDNWADKFQKLPMYYLTFHGAQEVIILEIKTLVAHIFFFYCQIIVILFIFSLKKF